MRSAPALNARSTIQWTAHVASTQTGGCPKACSASASALVKRIHKCPRLRVEGDYVSLVMRQG